MKTLKISKRQNGAVLIVGLVLLLVITVLAISGMNTATTALAMARNDQNYENAFQAAETGLESAISQGGVFSTATVDLTQNIRNHDNVSTRIVFEETTIVPDKAFSMGVGSGGAVAWHYKATATAESKRGSGTTDRDASAIHSQAFYKLGRPPGTI